MTNDAQADLEFVVQQANAEVEKLNPHGRLTGFPGTTMVIARLSETNVLDVAWAGDSRIYIYTDHDVLMRLTQDHEDHNGILTSCLGYLMEVGHHGGLELHDGELLILATDGLFNYSTDTEIEEVIRDSERTPQAVNARLADLCESKGAPDNYTFTTVMV
jgi:serine/threonine protein phosphatase PrpC